MKILFVTTVSHTPSQRNLNHWQRVYFLSRAAELSILSVRGADFAASAKPGSAVIQSAIKGKVGLLLHGALMALRGQAGAFDIVVTEPSLIGIVGFWFRFAGCRRWIVDVWDIPGRYEPNGRTRVQRRRALARSLLRFIYRFADLFIVSILPDFEFRQFNVRRDRMLLCRNAIWLDGKNTVLPRESTPQTIICMRTVYYQDMGLDILAAAFERLKKSFPEVKLTLVGNIPPHVEEQVKRLRNFENVEFINFLDHAALSSRIAGSTICVIPFRDVDDCRQTLNVKVLEYMALGKPVVASNLAGMRTMIEHGKTGLLFRPGDSVDLSEKLACLLSDDTLRRRIVRSAIAAVAEFDCVEKNRRIIAALEALD